jgi:hypothetical protein
MDIEFQNNHRETLLIGPCIRIKRKGDASPLYSHMSINESQAKIPIATALGSVRGSAGLRGRGWDAPDYNLVILTQWN